jgi:hypothetical protein
MELPPLEETDLRIVELETDSGDTSSIYFLLERSISDSFDPQAFFDKLDVLFVDEDPDVDKLDDLFDEFGVLEMLDDEEFVELIDEGEIDPEDIHPSLYEFLTEED